MSAGSFSLYVSTCAYERDSVNVYSAVYIR